MNTKQTILHATTVAVGDKAVVIRGETGAGKSALALQLLALGARLISDDQTDVVRDGDILMASAPKPIQGLIEARGVGILQVPYGGPTRIALIVDLSKLEKERLPYVHSDRILDITLPCLHKVASAHFPAAIALYLKGSRKEPQ